MFGFLVIYVPQIGTRAGQVLHAVFSEPDRAAIHGERYARKAVYDTGQVWTSEGVAYAVAHFKQSHNL